MSLRDRLPMHDTISQFELARVDRLEDALVLAAGGRRFGAIYVLGYFVEMTLKSAFFRFLGFSLDEAIRPGDLKAAAQLAKADLSVKIHPESYHSLTFWVRAIIELRTTFGSPLPRDLTRELGWRVQRLHSNWSVMMRYCHDVSQVGDWESVHADATWVDGQFNQLISYTTEVTG